MNAPTTATADTRKAFVSLDGRTSIEVRHASHPDAVRSFTTAMLREHFLLDGLFRPDRVALTYSHVDRMVVGGAMPIHAPLPLEALKPIGAQSFLQRRELGLINLGGAGRVSVDGAMFELAPLDALYVARGATAVHFESADAAAPARFYLLSAPAHATHQTRRIARAEAMKIPLGSKETANLRTIHQVIHPAIVASCQLVMGYTVLEPGSIWNTMPTHLHDRRCEVYCYFDLAPDARVFHLMGEPSETRHIVVANEQAVISPSWSIHSGAGTTNYSFVWAMAGDNQDFDDMDMLPMVQLR